MQVLFVTRNEDGRLVFTPTAEGPASNFCQKKRSDPKSKCEAYYSEIFTRVAPDARRQTWTCPYGLNSVGLIYWTERARIASGFILDNKRNAVPEDVRRVAAISAKEIESFLAAFDSIASEYFKHSYEYLESAIHDVRHLNSAITSHAERLLKQFGYDMGQEWDLSSLNRSETGRKALSIFCASRDISAALSMHEIAIDPKRAKDELVPHHIHKIFYKQWQISADKILEKKLSVTLGNTSRILQLTKSFSLIPMILLNNAVKYSNSGAAIKVDFVEAGTFFRIVCTNTGPVLREDEIPKVFDKHWRGSNKTGISGHGIGLWLAKLIVNANLGKMEFAVKEKGRDVAGRRIGETTVTVSLLASS